MAALGVSAAACFDSVALAGAAPTAWVSGPGATLTRTLPIQTIPPGGAANTGDVQINAKTNRVYFTNEFTVTVLDSASDAIIANIPIPASNINNPNGYGGNYQSCVDDLTNTVYTLSEVGIVTAINGVNNTVKGSFAPWGSETIYNVDGMVCNPETGKLYMSLWNAAGAYVVVWDTRKQKRVAVLPGAREWFAVNRKTNRIYYSYQGGSQVAVIDGATDTIIALIGAGQPYVPAGCDQPGCGTQVSDLKQLAVDEARNLIYVVGDADGILTTIDGNTNRVIATEFYDYFLYSIAIDPVRQRIYAVDGNTDEMIIVDGASGKRLGNLSVGSGPFPLGCAGNNNPPNYVVNVNVACAPPQGYGILGYVQGIAANPVNGKIYAGYGGNYFGFVAGIPANYAYLLVLQPALVSPAAPPSAVTRMQNDVLAGTVTLAAGAGAVDAAISTLANTLYIANSGASTVTALNLASLSTTATIPVGAAPRAITINESAWRLYTFNADGSVSVLDSAGNKLIANFPVDTNASGLLGLNPQAIAYSRRTGKLYAINGFNQIDVVDPVAQIVIATISDPDASKVAINQSTNTVYVTQYSDGAVWVIDGYSDRKIGVIGGVGLAAQPAGCFLQSQGPYACLVMPSGLTSIAVDEALNRVYVLGQYDGSVVTIDGQANQVIGEQFINPGNYGLAVDPGRHAVFADSFLTPALWDLDGQTGQILSVVNFTSNFCNAAGTPCYGQTDLKSVSVNPATGSVYVLDQGDLNPHGTSLLYVVNPASSH